MAGEPIVITCDDCDEQPTFVERPLADGGSDYVLVCDCDGRGIDVTECTGRNKLLETLSGKWSTFRDRDRQ